MAEKATIYDVAKKANVSLATVSRVLNDSSKVRQATADKVHKAIEELKYTPNLVARGLASKKTTTVALIVPDIKRASIASMTSGIIDIADHYGYSIKLFVKGPHSKGNIANRIVSEQVEGVIFLEYLMSHNNIDDSEKSELKKILNKYDIPVVLVNGTAKSKDLCTVSIDYLDATYDTTKLLVDEGRKNILFITNERNYAANEERLHGYTKCIEEFGLTPQVLKTVGDVNVNEPIIYDYLANHDVDGIVAVRDSFGITAINVLRALNKKVPDDVSVIGMQNSRLGLYSRPKLSTLYTAVENLGAIAMRALTKLINNEELVEKQIFLNYDIVKRGSTK